VLRGAPDRGAGGITGGEIDSGDTVQVRVGDVRDGITDQCGASHPGAWREGDRVYQLSLAKVHHRNRIPATERDDSRGPARGHAHRLNIGSPKRDS
jgi:hypothetical protein